MNHLKNIIYAIRLIFIGCSVYLLCQLKLDRQVLLWGSFILTFLPELFTKITKVKVPIGIRVFYTLFIFGSQFLGSFLGAYGYFSWWDMMLHTISGVLIGYIALLIFLAADPKGRIFESHQIKIVVLFVFATSIAGAGIWEIIEFTGDTFLGMNAQLGSLQDTMIDIICGTLGGSLYALYIGWMMKKQRPCIIDRLLDENGINKRNKK